MFHDEPTPLVPGAPPGLAWPRQQSVAVRCSGRSDGEPPRLARPDTGEPETVSPAFGVVLRRFRERDGWTQNALAKRAALNASYINRLESQERDAPTRAVVRALASVLARGPTEVDILHAAAGYLPPRLERLGPADATLRAVVRVLTDDHLSPAARADFRAVVETIAARWGDPPTGGPACGARALPAARRRSA